MNDKLFVKLHLNAFHSGLMSELDANSWRLLCALACYMNEERKCWPSQAELARKFGVSEKSVERWVHNLKAFRRNGKPIVTVEKRPSKKYPGRFYNVYTLHPETCFSIFGDNGISGGSDSWRPATTYTGEDYARFEEEAKLENERTRRLLGLVEDRSEG